MTDKEKIADLLSNQPLYKKVSINKFFFDHPTNLENLTFSFYCSVDNSFQTFKLTLEPEKILSYFGTRINKDEFDSYFDSFDDHIGKNKFVQHYSATCQFCNNCKIDFLIKLETEDEKPKNNVDLTFDEYEQQKQIVRKIGQYPAFEISPDKVLLNFFNEEDKNNYRKSLICRSQNYGIGAFAYLRRIVENEMIRIVEDLAKIDRPESAKIKGLLSSFKENHVMSNLIEGVYDYLPSSLKSLGDNPLKVLYGQLSGGIHQFSEEECFEKASTIDTLLRFVIKKIMEENSDVKLARDAMKHLRK